MNTAKMRKKPKHFNKILFLILVLTFYCINKSKSMLEQEWKPFKIVKTKKQKSYFKLMKPYYYYAKIQINMIKKIECAACLI